MDISRKKQNIELPRIVQLLSDEKWVNMERSESERDTIYINEGRYEERFTNYFCTIASKVIISKNKGGRVNAGVNAIVNIGGQIGMDRGETIEIDLQAIEPHRKALYVEFYLRSINKLVDPIKEDVQQQGVLYKCEDVSYVVLAENKKGIYDLIGEKQGEVVINEYNRQENIYRASSTKGYRFIWILPSKDRTLAAIVSKKYLKYKSAAA